MRVSVNAYKGESVKAHKRIYASTFPDVTRYFMTTVRLLKNGNEAFPAMFKAIDGARTCIALEMYILADDETGREFRSHLVDAARRGISVMVLVDSFGSWALPDSFWEGLRSAGGEVRWFRQFKHGLFMFRNHRKLLLIDNHTVYLGGFNVADEYYRGVNGELPWRDNALEVSGDEVAPLRSSFTRMWIMAELPIHRVIRRLKLVRLRRDSAVSNIRQDGVRFLESGLESPLQPVRKRYLTLIGKASVSIDLAMGYFYPPGSILRALKRAVRRGVRVRLLFSRKNDVPMAGWAARGLYGRLLHAGIEVWEYLPTMLHAKLAVVDDTVIAGSANLDIRSGRINYELVAVVHDPAIAARAREDFEEDLEQSEQVSFAQWRARPFIQKWKERISYWLLARADIFAARADLARRMR
jgi:cardiolipin synthase